MAEEQPVVNGLDEVAVKTEPTDPLDSIEPPIIPKEFTVSNGFHEDSDCEDISYFTQVEVDNTRKCLENTKLIIKDFETQLDWHLQQYMTLRNIFNTKKNSKDGKDDGSKRQDLLSISQLSAIIANHPEGNKKFIKRKGPISNGAGGRKRRKNKDSESEEETDFSDEDSEFDEEDFDMGESEEEDDPGAVKKTKKARGKKGKAFDDTQVKDEIEEEVHELIEPKEEIQSDEEMMEEESFEVKKTPAKRGRKPKGEETKTPAKKGGRGKKGKNLETVDLTNIKNCKVVLNRLGKDDDDDEDVEIKEEIDRDELVEMLKEKAVNSIENFSLDPEKPIAILKDDNVKAFDFNECKTSNVVVTFEDSESFPEFIFIKNVADHILEGSIILVHANVFDQHLSGEEKN
ncbi:hypothetical protein Zmor_013183 [Zophobas morio]|uniref:Uncharacterized protein n=1 Tax=Zophobas morio TaxID=2755281 RepID=A0AA38MFE0_9CUCU|nr:hypothetical protein Zmor_013183 [Zophobas morio]